MLNIYHDHGIQESEVDIENRF